MNYHIIILVLCLVPLQLSANSEASFSCKSNRFLKSSFILNLPLSGDGFLGEIQSDSLNQPCSLEIVENADGALVMTPLGSLVDSLGDNCSLVNWSRPHTERQLKEIIVSPAFIENEGGYLKLSLDNSMADYGPNFLTSFIYCQSL